MGLSRVEQCPIERCTEPATELVTHKTEQQVLALCAEHATLVQTDPKFDIDVGLDR